MKQPGTGGSGGMAFSSFGAAGMAVSASSPQGAEMVAEACQENQRRGLNSSRSLSMLSRGETGFKGSVGGPWGQLFGLTCAEGMQRRIMVPAGMIASRPSTMMVCSFIATFGIERIGAI